MSLLKNKSCHKQQLNDFLNEAEKFLVLSFESKFVLKINIECRVFFFLFFLLNLKENLIYCVWLQENNKVLLMRWKENSFFFSFFQ